MSELAPFMALGLIACLVILAVLSGKYTKLKTAYKKYEPIQDVDSELANIKKDIADLKNQYAQKKELYDKLAKETSIYEDKLEDINIGLSEPVFMFDDPEDYKNAILNVRQQQKEMVKEKSAIICTQEWTVNGSKKEGKKMSNEKMKLTLRSFNNECDVIICNVSWKNYQQSITKIENTYEFFNKYNDSSAIKITHNYLRLKKKELQLVYEHQERKQQIKEEQRAIREQMREEEKLEKERIAAEKEEEKYQKLLEKAKADAAKATGDKLESMNSEIEKLNTLLKEAQEKNQRAISMAQQTRAGHVYVISNIGAFGEGVFKIGMTRRLEPLDRVRELGDASVPFEFDVHALISSSDAPSLENKLHIAFEKYRMNLVNNKREFFRVPLDLIEQEVKKESPNSDFVRTALAEQYRKSEAIRRQREQQESVHQEQKAFPEAI